MEEYLRAVEENSVVGFRVFQNVVANLSQDLDTFEASPSPRSQHNLVVGID